MVVGVLVDANDVPRPELAALDNDAGVADELTNGGVALLRLADEILQRLSEFLVWGIALASANCKVALAAPTLRVFGKIPERPGGQLVAAEAILHHVV